MSGRGWSLREVTGLVLIIAGVAALPLTWMFSRLWWAACFLLVLIGVVLFLTDRISDRLEEDRKQGSDRPVRPEVPGDVHNYSGWRSGGRSETMDGHGADGD